MQLSDEQYEKIEQLAPLHYTGEQLSVIFDLDPIEFVRDFHDANSQINYHYKRGILMAKSDMDLKLLEEAKAGNITAYQQFQKEQYFNKLENVKQKTLIQFELTEVEKIKQKFLQGPRALVLSIEEEQRYEQLDFVRALVAQNNSKNYVVNAARKSFDMSIEKAQQLFVDAVNMFYMDRKIQKDAWSNLAAERLENAALVCLEMNKFKEFRDCIMDAAKLRGIFEEEKNVIPRELLQKPITIYNVDQSYFKLPRPNLKKMATFIDTLNDIPEMDRKRLHREAMTKGSSVFDIIAEDIPYAIIEESKS